MSDQNEIRLFDRVKEITYSQGASPSFALAGAADGFSPLDRFYAHDEVVFYAATDGSDYEVGSGVFKRADFDPNDSITYNELERFPFRSSNPDDSIVSFSPGVKEVFITYPATHSVMMGSGLPSLNTPQRKGVAVWDSENILNYFSDLTYDSSLKSLGIDQPNHFYGVDLGGNSSDYSSRVRASGYYVGNTGVYFQSNNGSNADFNLSSTPYQGGTQFVHFTPNETDEQFPINEQTNSHDVIQVSGDVNQYILLQKQTAHTVWCGPIDDCDPICEEGYPLFRRLVTDDLPIDDLEEIFVSVDALLVNNVSMISYIDSQVAQASGYAITYASGVQDNLDAHITTYETSFSDFEIATSGRVDDMVLAATAPRYCTVRGDSDVPNHINNYFSIATPTKFPFAHVESESQVGDWDSSEYTYTVPDDGAYLVTAEMAGKHDNGVSPPMPMYRVVTSGSTTNTITNYLDGMVPGANNGDISASSRTWTVPVEAGDKIYVEASGGVLHNYSTLTIRKI